MQHPLLTQHCLRRAVGNDRTLLEDDQPIGCLDEGGNDVLHPDHRNAVAVARFADVLNKSLDLGGCKSRGDLVDEKELWPAG